MIKKIAIYGTLILCTLLLVTCTTDEESMVGPFGDASKYISATAFTVDNNVVYADGDSTTVTIVLIDSDRQPLEGLKVLFSTNLGKITKSDITDSTGTAEAVFVTEEETGEATIIVNTGAKSFETIVNVIKYQPATIELSAESLVLLADGNEYTKITAIPLDEDGNKMKNITIEFNTDLGTLSLNAGSFGTATTLPTNSGDSGEDAIVYLRSNTNGGTAIVTASAGTTSALYVYFYINLPEYLSLTADPKVLLANGSSTSNITAMVLDDNLTAMEGIKVSFSTTAGKLPDIKDAITDENGEAKIVLTSDTEEGRAIVTASAYEYISDTTGVQFTLNIPDQIVISASPARVIADGSTVSTITAIPKDSDGNPMAGIDVSFSTTLGNLSKSYDETDANGIAEVELTSTVDGVATVTAAVSSVEALANVTFYEYNPVYIEIGDPSEESILADGSSKVDISATVYDADYNAIPGAIINFSTNYGHLNKTTGVVANQSGTAKVTLTSEGSTFDLDAWVKAQVSGTTLTDSSDIKLRGITIAPISVDSLRFAEGGYYKAYVSTIITETSEGVFVEGVGIEFTSTLGEMETPISTVDEFGVASSVMKSEVSGSPQYNLIITAQLPNANNISQQTQSLEIPGVETLVKTIDDEVMGDGESWALVKATLRETNGKAITNMAVEWETTLGTIIGRSLTNTNGHSIDTLRIENSVSTNTNVTISSHFGDNISDNETITLVPPVNDNRLILGFEPDTTGHGIIPCDIDTAIATRDVGISVLLVDEDGGGLDYRTISFSIVPNNFAKICPTAVTDANGLATVMMAYPPQNAGQIVRVWGEAPDGTRGNIDVVLPKDEEEGG